MVAPSKAFAVFQRECLGLAMAIWAEHSQVFETVVVSNSVSVVELNR